MGFETLEDGHLPLPGIIEGIGWGSMMLLIVNDSPPGVMELDYPLTLRFRDGEEECIRRPRHGEVRRTSSPFSMTRPGSRFPKWGRA